MPSPQGGENELRRLRMRADARKHHEDALRTLLNLKRTDDLVVAISYWASALYDAEHVSTHGVTHGGESVDTGAMESSAPKHEPRASALVRRELAWAETAAEWFTKRGDRLTGQLDDIVGESA